MDALPRHIVREREPVLDKVLSHLPDELLSALAYGLERHAGRLEAGRLYSDYDGGGCAVGVMLREMSPEAYRQGRLQFALRRHRNHSILTETVDLERWLVTRLSHVEMCFDRTTRTLCEDTDRADLRVAANLTGRWMAEGCRDALRARSRDGHVGFFVPEDWAVSRSPQAAMPTSSPGGADVARASSCGARFQVRRSWQTTPGIVAPDLRAAITVRRMTRHDGTVAPVSVSLPPLPTVRAAAPVLVTNLRRRAASDGSVASLTLPVAASASERQSGSAAELVLV